MPGAKEKKPGKNAPRAKVVEWLKRHWDQAWWGLVDCDRCQQRAHAYPCDACTRWIIMVAKHRRGEN